MNAAIRQKAQKIPVQIYAARMDIRQKLSPPHRDRWDQRALLSAKQGNAFDVRISV